MPRPGPPDSPRSPSDRNGGAGPVHVQLWFVVHRLTDDTRRGACYLCGWWSDPCDDEPAAQQRLRIHCAGDDHRELAGPLPAPYLTIDESPGA